MIREIDFDLSIYPFQIIQRAISDYAKIATIRLSVSAEMARCTFYSSKYDLELTEKEFSNYVLSLSAVVGGEDV